MEALEVVEICVYLDPAVIIVFVLLQGSSQIWEQGLNCNRLWPQEVWVLRQGWIEPDKITATVWRNDHCQGICRK